MDFYQIPGDKIIQINLKHCHPLTKKQIKLKLEILMKNKTVSKIMQRVYKNK